MKLYVIPSWYPSKLNPANGTFFVDWAGILGQAGHNVVIIANLLHPFRKLLKYSQLPKRTYQPGMEFGLLTYRREAINLRPKLVKKTFRVYKKSLISQFEQVLKQQGRPDIVLIHSSLWAGAALAERLASEAIPFIVVEHLKALLVPDGFNDYQKSRVREVYRHAGKIVAVSSALEMQLLRIFPEAQGKTTTIHNPVAMQMAAAKSVDRGKDTDFTFITVSLFRAEKRIDVLLNAFAGLVGLGKSVKLKLVGDGPLRRVMKRRALRLGLEDRIEFSGYLTREKVAGELGRSDCLVLSSEVETFGMALVEALAAGLPVISTRSGGPEDIVTEETGVLVPVNNEAALGRAMQTMMEDHSKYAPEEIRRYALDKFGAKVYVDAFQSVFEELCASQ